jgi:hypothetical protein
VAAYLANVGVNASHGIRSPLRADGSFVVWPIPERMPWAPPMLRLGDIDPDAPPRWRARPVHADPDLRSGIPTYGDNCRRAGRAFSLRRAEPGDVILFMARLHPPEAPPSLHVIGMLEIADLIRDVGADPGLGWWDGNAHVRRARATGAWDQFWVFKGTPRSRFFPAAHRFDSGHANELLGVTWPATRTEQQTIASHTRAVRRLTGDAERTARDLWTS